MSIFQRISDIFKANINDALDKAEDPEKMLNQIISDMQESLIESKKQVAVAIADEKRLAGVDHVLAKAVAGARNPERLQPFAAFGGFGGQLARLRHPHQRN